MRWDFTKILKIFTLFALFDSISSTKKLLFFRLLLRENECREWEKTFFYEFIFPVLVVFEGTLHFDTFHDLTIISRNALLGDKVQWKWWKFDKIKYLKNKLEHSAKKLYVLSFFDEFRYFFVMGFVSL